MREYPGTNIFLPGEEEHDLQKCRSRRTEGGMVCCLMVFLQVFSVFFFKMNWWPWDRMNFFADIGKVVGLKFLTESETEDGCKMLGRKALLQTGRQFSWDFLFISSVQVWYFDVCFRWPFFPHAWRSLRLMPFSTSFVTTEPSGIQSSTYILHVSTILTPSFSPRYRNRKVRLDFIDMPGYGHSARAKVFGPEALEFVRNRRLGRDDMARFGHIFHLEWRFLPVGWEYPGPFKGELRCHTWLLAIRNSAETHQLRLVVEIQYLQWCFNIRAGILPSTVGILILWLNKQSQYFTGVFFA